MSGRELLTDPTLLTIARRVLSTSGFRVREEAIPGVPSSTWLLAESEFFILAVVAGQDLDDLRELESYAATALSDALVTASIGPKRWDAYVVLLGSTDAGKRGSRAVVDLQYNTRSLRRIISLGVAPEDEDVRRVLSAFLPLPALEVDSVASAMDGLVEQLVINGVTLEGVHEAIKSFRDVEKDIDE